ncbi:glycerate kinase, partial [Paenibacillus xylanexedens]|uniref:glycerate kinase n=1 Tax=Paenibacillus xylanexedens TaxID=528191 RepID=UPI0016425976
MRWKQGGWGVFGAEKGARGEMVGVLDGKVCDYGDVVKEEVDKDIGDVGGGGAGGGLGGGVLMLREA